MRGRESGMPPAEVWDAFFEPVEALAALAGDRVIGDVVEFGSGYGTFTIPMARRTTGIVHALDIDPCMVAATAARAAQADLDNVHAVQRDFVIDGSGRGEGTTAFVLLFNILHIEDPVGLLKEAQRILRPGGRVGITHWIRDARTPRGPSLEIRPTPDQCRAWGAEAGLSLLRRCALPGSPWHWGMLLERA